jgi:hypothetical protein
MTYLKDKIIGPILNEYGVSYPFERRNCEVKNKKD